jgi:hypothetical protein
MTTYRSRYVLPVSLVVFACISDPLLSQERLRPVAAIQRDASIAAAERAIDEATLPRDREMVAGIRERIDDLLAESDSLGAVDYDPLDNNPPRRAFIVNGTSTFAFGAVGALLVGTDAGDAAIKCSGTMIGCETFLTARHCVEGNSNNGNYHIYLQAEGIFGVADILPPHPDYSQPFADLQLLKLSRPITAVLPAGINTAIGVLADTPGTIIGFGYTGFLKNNHGIKRGGPIVTDACHAGDEGFICWLYDYMLSTTCNVDSGGPLFLSPSNANATVVGVNASADASCLADVQSIEVDVRHFSEWILQQGGADIGQPGCTPRGSGPVKAEEVLAVDGFVSAGHPKNFEVTIPDEALEVRIALNAEDRQENNLDLSVVVESTIAGSEKTCNQTGSGNFAFCAFDLQESDSIVQITVSQNENMTGTGHYQMLVTLFSDPGGSP